MTNQTRLYRIDRPKYDSSYNSYRYVVQVMDGPNGDYFFRDKRGFDDPSTAQLWIDMEKANKIGEVQ